MIPVAPAPEPASFDAEVRRRGLDALAEMVGEPASRTRPGPRRAVIAASRDQIPIHKLPDFWRAALPDLREAYGNLCAYLGLYLHPATGDATVDHFVPKGRDWRLVYEWSNYRLSSSIINAHKLERQVALDPFAIEPGLFALELSDFQVIPGPTAHGGRAAIVEDTIRALGLNHRQCRQARGEYVEHYRLGPPAGIALARLERRAPFVAVELRRQGLLVRSDI